MIGPSHINMQSVHGVEMEGFYNALCQRGSVLCHHDVFITV